MSNRIAAVETLADRKFAGRAGAFERGIDRRTAHHRIDDGKLREGDVEIAEETAGPGAARQHHRVAGDAALLGDNGRYAPGGCFNSTHGTICQELRTLPARAMGDGRCCHEGLGVAIGGCEKGTLPAPGRSGLQLRRFIA